MPDATNLLWFYLWGALATVISQLHTRAIAGLGPPIVVDRWYRRPAALRAISFTKGIIWGVLWPLMWIMLLAASARGGSQINRRSGS
jgi:hypothetical protein